MDPFDTPPLKNAWTRKDYLQVLKIATNRLSEKINMSAYGALGFIINSNFVVKAADITCKILHYEMAEIEAVDFTDLIHPASLNNWETLPLLQPDSKDSCDTVEIVFLTQEKYVIPAFCYVSRFEGNYIFVIAFSHLMLTPQDTLYLRKAIDNIKHNATSTAPRSRRLAYASQIMKAHQYILTHLSESITIHDLEVEAALNRNMLYHGFKVLFGTTVYELTTRERLLKACTLLRENTSVTSVANALGYSVNGFKRLFHKWIGCSPGKYQKDPQAFESTVAQLTKYTQYDDDDD